MQPTTAGKLVAMAVAATMLASLLYVNRVSRQAEVAAATLQGGAAQYHQRVEQAIDETEAALVGEH